MDEGSFQDYRLLLNETIKKKLKLYLNSHLNEIESKYNFNFEVSCSLMFLGYAFLEKKGYNTIYCYLLPQTHPDIKGGIIVPITFTIPMTKRKVFEIISTNIDIDYYIIDNYFYVAMDSLYFILMSDDKAIFNSKVEYLELTSDDVVYQTTIGNDFSKIQIVIENDSSGELVTNYYCFQGPTLYKIIENNKNDTKNNQNNKLSLKKGKDNTSGYFSSIINTITGLFYSDDNKMALNSEKLKIK